jgi:hypothetical protein
MEGLRITFGHVIAFFLPGIVTTRAVSYFFPTIQTALDSLISGQSAALGQTVFLAGIAATLGLALSAIRGQYLDGIFGWFMRGCRRATKGAPDWRTNYERVKAAGQMWDKAVENVFRYYQFTANLSLALFVLFLARMVYNAWEWNPEGAISVGILGGSVLLVVTAYLQFKEWCRVRNSVLRTEAEGAEITNTGTAAATDSPSTGTATATDSTA